MPDRHKRWEQKEWEKVEGTSGWEQEEALHGGANTLIPTREDLCHSRGMGQKSCCPQVSYDTHVFPRTAVHGKPTPEQRITVASAAIRSFRDGNEIQRRRKKDGVVLPLVEQLTERCKYKHIVQIQDRKDGAESVQRKMLLVIPIAYGGIVPRLQLS